MASNAQAFGFFEPILFEIQRDQAVHRKCDLRNPQLNSKSCCHATRNVILDAFVATSNAARPARFSFMRKLSLRNFSAVAHFDLCME